MRGMIAGKALILAWSLVSSGCGLWAPAWQSSSEPKQFFQNARRRDATDAEGDLVLSLLGCTAFFIENTKNQAIVTTARHCFNFKESEFCANGGTFSTNDGFTGRCLNVLAGDAEHDIVMFRAEFPFLPGPDRTLRPSGFAPDAGTRLKMIGFPTDPERQGRLTVTEQCWILQTSSDRSPLSAKKLLDETARHNCSSYGGNSGGPMMIEGSRIVVGLPFSFIPNDFTLYPGDNVRMSAYMARIADFADRHKSILTDAGVVIANRDEINTVPAPAN